jgi:prephenate dehydrogenase
VGSGLIGTSMGLALQGQLDVLLTDADGQVLAQAARRGAGRVWDGAERVDHAVLAVPPAAVASTLTALQRRDVARTWSHVASTQSVVQAEVETSGAEFTQVCGSHPMAGRERPGPAAASADLFAGRPWALCPSPATSRGAFERTRVLAELCGADPVVLSAAEHDVAVALVSHLPQVTASALAAVVLAEGGGRSGAVRLAGPGLQDTTRIAASDPALWLDVLRQNAAAVAPLVRGLAAELVRVADELDRSQSGSGRELGAAPLAAVADLLRRGNAGRELIPVKHGEHDRDFAVVPVGVSDRPGQIAGVLVAAAEAGVNVEDVRVEHLAGRPRGVVRLLVQTAEQEHAREALGAAGWDVLG